jgi:hypothetical protein
LQAVQTRRKTRAETKLTEPQTEKEEPLRKRDAKKIAKEDSN